MGPVRLTRKFRATVFQNHQVADEQKVIGGMGRLDGFLGDGNMDTWNMGMGDGMGG